MVKKLQKTSAAKKSPAQLPGAVKDSAQQIWLAGLAAFTKAQNEGGKVFETLAKEGLSIQRKTQAAAEEKITEATSKMANMATGITSKATGQWDKLENIFEERVAKALNKLGVPSSKDVDALIARIDELNKNVQQLSAKAAASAKSGAPKTAAAKPARKSAPKSAKSAAKPATKRAATRKATAPVKTEAAGA
ncbi:MAG TPA: phasin family protein [Burkholderiaceae bacterium]|uniref:phasin family protein n=1 Tax=Candidatus Skiveiella danica TaxID=3386177 RepID=UPI002C61BE6A|nr:phasin family protein [Burkholderiaceae bacterium]HOS85683.1 phasin family protein [Burkholderiaceae bacterium]